MFNEKKWNMNRKIIFFKELFVDQCKLEEGT